jgi:hypothetical protein
MEQLRGEEITASIQNPNQSRHNYPQTQRPEDLPTIQNPALEQVLTRKRPIAARHNPIIAIRQDSL